MRRPILFITHDPALDMLAGHELDRVTEGQPDDCWRPIGDGLALLLDKPGGRPVGFMVHPLSEFDLDACGPGVWGEPQFDAPLLGLRSASVGEVYLAAIAYFRGQPSHDRNLFDMATRCEGDLAVGYWETCLESGQQMAHFGLGYTLLEGGRALEAYRHLRYYAELAPEQPWVHVWHAKAALAIGERSEAIRAFERAVEIEATGGEETDAADLLAEVLEDA